MFPKEVVDLFLEASQEAYLFVHLFAVCSASEHAVNKSVYVAPNERMVINDELQTRERQGFWFNLKNYPKFQ